MDRRGRITAFLGLIFLLFDAAVAAGSQKPAKKDQKGKTSEQSGTFSIKVPVDVVIVSATVSDKRGNPVRDLSSEDFQIFEDGKLQPIHTFTVEAHRPPKVATAHQSDPDDIARREPVASSASMPRLFRLVVDDVTLKEFDQLHFLTEGLKKFLTEDLGPDDQVSLCSASGIVDHPFTSNRQQMSNQLMDLIKRARPLKSRLAECPPLTDLQAHNIASDLEDGLSIPVGMKDMELCNPFPSVLELRMQAKAHENEMRFQTRTLLTSLRSTVRALKHFEGKKVLVLCSTGFLSQEFIYELQDLIDGALRSGVVINTLDPSGLTTNALTAEQRTAGTGMIFAQKSMLQSLSRTAQDGPLMKLAEDTGGLSFSNSNDLHAGFKSFAERESVFYIISYASPNIRIDGSYHKIRLEVRRPGLEVSYRRGYYAPKEELSYERRGREEILDALRAPGGMQEIPVRLSYNYALSGEAHYALDLTSEVNMRQVQFAHEDGRHRNVIQIVMAIYDEADHYVDGYEKILEFNLSDASYDHVLKYGLSSKVGFTLAPGRYKAMAVVRENQKTRMGSAEKIIEVP